MSALSHDEKRDLFEALMDATYTGRAVADNARAIHNHIVERLNSDYAVTVVTVPDGDDPETAAVRFITADGGRGVAARPETGGRSEPVQEQSYRDEAKEEVKPTVENRLETHLEDNGLFTRDVYRLFCRNAMTEPADENKYHALLEQARAVVDDAIDEVAGQLADKYVRRFVENARFRVESAADDPTSTGLSP